MPCSASENLYTLLDLFQFYSSLRLWAVSGEVLMEMVGHTAIVYSVDSHASGLIVSGSEDRFAKIWKGDDLFLASCYRDHAYLNTICSSLLPTQLQLSQFIAS
jgi:WD40 repeat protein